MTPPLTRVALAIAYLEGVRNVVAGPQPWPEKQAAVIAMLQGFGAWMDARPEDVERP